MDVLRETKYVMLTRKLAGVNFMIKQVNMHIELSDQNQRPFILSISRTTLSNLNHLKKKKQGIIAEMDDITGNSD
jgi:hypothetical protein